MAAVYDFKDINEIPIEDVLAFHGIYPNAKGWYSIRPEDDTPSAHIDQKRRFGNTIHDFGETGADSNTFSPITLTMYLRGLDANVRENWTEAARILGEAFGVEPKYSEKDGKQVDRDTLSDWEWKKLDIHPDMASKNMTFDPERYGHERTRVYADNYRMSMNELRERSKTDSSDKGVYERILRSKGVAYVLELKNAYYARLHNHSTLQLPDVENMAEVVASDVEFQEEAKALTAAEDVLMKAIKGTSIKYKPNRKPYDVLEDYYRVANGEVGFEIGKVSQYDIHAAAYQDKVKVFECLVSRDEYYKLMLNGLDNIQYAAKQKGDKIKISFMSTDSGRVNYLVRALRGIERDVTENHDRNRAIEEEITEDVVIIGQGEVSSEKPANKGEIAIT